MRKSTIDITINMKILNVNYSNDILQSLQNIIIDRNNSNKKKTEEKSLANH